MQGRKYETTGNARKGIGDAAWYASLIVFLVMAFIVASVAALLPAGTVDHDAGYLASELELEESSNGQVTVISYVDADGAVVNAIDMGYAAVRRTLNADSRVTEELYFDAAGEPVKRYDMYYGVGYDYGENSIVIRYLDEDENPMLISSGYAQIVRTLDGEGRAIDDFYYDENMRAVQCTGGYYGLHREYDAQGWNDRITYLDEHGQAVCSTAGYASIRYERDADGNVSSVFYFDAQNRPVPAALGQYGEAYQRDGNGRIVQTTYLDVEGNAALTNAGYAIARYTYHRDGASDTSRYFDAEDRPVALSKGQYGIRSRGNVNLLLDQNGHVMLCVDNFLNGFPYMVVVFGCLLCLLLILLPGRMKIVLMLAYVLFIFYETLMFREAGEARTNFVLFSYAGRFFSEPSVRTGVVNNVWLFIPLGTGLYMLFRKKWVVLVPFLLSIAIEAIQYVTGLGIAEFDDVFGNTLGGGIGVMVAWVVISNLKRKRIWY